MSRLSSRASDNPNAGKRRAFTLMEVLIALAIFAMASVFLGAAYLNVLIGYQTAVRDTQADEDIRFARSEMMLLADRKKVEEGGNFDSLNGRRIQWKAEIISTNLPDLFDVVFTSEISDPGKPTKTISEKIRLLRPTWSEAGERQKLRAETQKRIEEMNVKAK